MKLIVHSDYSGQFCTVEAHPGEDYVHISIVESDVTLSPEDARALAAILKFAAAEVGR